MKMRFPLAIAILVLALGLRNYSLESEQNLCRCGPRDDCWPPAEDWNNLNESISGALIPLRPAGDVCYGAQYSQKACDEVAHHFRNTTWRALNPSTLQIINWENWRQEKQSCHISNANNITQCEQGRVAIYSAFVESVQQVQQVVRFAAIHHLRLSIRNTGHDLAGRSSAPGSLQIHTAGLKGIQHTDSFHPTAPWGRAVESAGPAVTVGAGVMTGELYTAAAEAGYTVVGGSCSTVGIAGGWIQGGGYGILSPSRGLGVDNVLELSMVTAEGAYVTANQYQNQDLFWAVRGGGGGTFGVITSVTFRTFPDLPVTVSKLNMFSTDGADEAYWDGVEKLMRTLPSIVHCGSAVQAFAIPVLPSRAAALSSEFYLMNQTSSNSSIVLQSLKHSLKGLGFHVESVDETFSRLSTYLSIPKGLDQAGVAIMTASRLLSRDLLESATGPAHISQTLARLKYHPGDVLSFDGMLTGQIKENEDRVDASLHPEWRSALMSLTFGRALPSEPDWETYQTIENDLRYTQLPLIESLERKPMCGYLGIPFPHEQYPARTFWGSNYARLLKIKRRWDPTDLFITRLGVASEKWDDEGICRIASESRTIYSLIAKALSWFLT